MGSSGGVCSLGYPGGFRLAWMKIRCGSSMVACILWTFMTLGVQESQQCYRCRRYVSIRIIFYPLAAGSQRTSLAGPSPLLSISGLQRSTLTAMFLSWSAAGAEIRGENNWSLNPLHVTQQKCPASMSAQLYSKGIPQHVFPPSLPLGVISL